MAELIDIPEVNIFVHNAGGWTLPISRKDQAGAVVNISARAYRLKTATGLDVLAIADPENALAKLMVLTELQVDALGPPGTETPYALVDTTSDPDETLCFGRLIAKGW